MKTSTALKLIASLLIQALSLNFAEAQSKPVASANSSAVDSVEINMLPASAMRFSQRVLIDAKIGADAKSTALINKLLEENPQVEAVRIIAKNGKSVFILRNTSKQQLSSELRSLISIDSGGWQPEELTGEGFGKKALANLISEISRTSQCNMQTIISSIAKVDCQADMLVLSEDLGADAGLCLER